MYESHFGFSGSPFQLNPDPAFYFDSRGHSNALAYLKFGAHQGEGFIVVTGEIGAGKTTLVRTLLEGLNPEQVVAAQVVSTQLESGELLQAILMAFGIASSSNSKAHLIGSLEAFLTALAARGRRALLIIDEAQNLKHEAVEELRMLSNFQLGKYGLLQSFLVGQPELRQLLQSKSMEQLRQRVIASCHLGPLDPSETRAYIEHRLRIVGWAGRPDFISDAFERIHFWAGGVPRKINRLCNRLLLGAFLSNLETITPGLVDRTAGELKSEIGELSEIPEVQLTPSLPSELDRASDRPVATARPSASARALQGDDLAAAAATAMSSTGAAQESRGKVRLVPGAAPAALPVEEEHSQALVPNKSEPSHAAARNDRIGVDIVSPSRMESRAPLTVVPMPRTGVMEAAGTSSPAADRAHDDQPAPAKIQRRSYRLGSVDRPLICLVDSTADFLKAGTLADVFLKFPNLPHLIAVQPGPQSTLMFGDTGADELPMPFAGLHLENLSASFATQTCQVLGLFEEIIDEFNPLAVLAMGNSDAVLACSLLANKRGVGLFRISGGQRKLNGFIERNINGSLIDKISDVLYVNQMDSYYTLYQEGIKSDRVLCVGNLIGDMLKYALPHAPSPSEILTAAGARNAEVDDKSGFALVDIEPAEFLREIRVEEAVVSFLCEIAKEFPIIWPAEVEVVNRLKASDYANRLEAAKVIVVPFQGYLQRLGLLENAKCLLEFNPYGLIEEAGSLRIPALRVTLDPANSELKVVDESDGSQVGTKLASQVLRRLLAKPSTPLGAPAYWDLGAATRVATHLGLWLPKIERTARSRS